MGAIPISTSPKSWRRPRRGCRFFGPEALEEYKRCFRNPATVHAMCEDYRATASVDLDMDTMDFAAGRKIDLPGVDPLGRDRLASAAITSRPAEVWPRYAADIRGAKALPCGHYLSEEAPEETYQELRAFFLAK